MKHHPIVVGHKSPDDLYRKLVNLAQEKWLELDLTDSKDDNELAMSITALAHLKWMNPSNPIEPTQSDLDSIVLNMSTMAQDIYGVQLTDIPEVRLVSSESYLDQLNAAVQRTKMVTNMGTSYKVPPRAATFPYEQLILVPDTHQRRTGYLEGDVDTFPWDVSFLEKSVFDQICLALVQQLRGEWGKPYAPWLKSVGFEGYIRTHVKNKLLVEFASEHSGREDWGLYTAHDTLHSSYANQGAFSGYQALASLATLKFFKELALPDEVELAEGGVCVGFDPTHPSHEKNMQNFGSSYMYSE